MESPAGPTGKAPDPPLVWHPGIRALGWLWSFSLTSFFAAVIWNVAAGVELQFGALLARAVWIWLALMLCSGLLSVFERWTGLLAHAYRNYDGWPMVVVCMVGTLLFLAIVSCYVWLASWPLAYVWLSLEKMSASLFSPGVPSNSMQLPPWLTALVLAGISIAAIGLVLFTVRHTWMQVSEAVRVLGVWRASRGAMLMFVLRHRLPRRDLLLMSPVLSIVPMMAASAWLYSEVEMQPFKWTLALLVLLYAVSHSIDTLAPPLWLYLGPSDFASFASFHRLRNSWRKNGLTLLNRLGPEGVGFYAVWRTTLPAGPLFYDPSIPRVWSLRTRDEWWEATVSNLMDYVPLVVVDVRGESEIVREEIEWLHLRPRMQKAWFIAATEGGVSAEERRVAIERYPLLDSTRLVSEDELAAGGWTRTGSNGPTIATGA